jgi:hypothetical protein
MKSRNLKQNEAKERQEKYNSLTKAQKLAAIKNRPGKSAKEVARLAA